MCKARGARGSGRNFASQPPPASFAMVRTLGPKGVTLDAPQLFDKLKRPTQGFRAAKMGVPKKEASSKKGVPVDPFQRCMRMGNPQYLTWGKPLIPFQAGNKM